MMHTFTTKKVIGISGVLITLIVLFSSVAVAEETAPSGGFDFTKTIKGFVDGYRNAAKTIVDGLGLNPYDIMAGLLLIIAVFMSSGTIRKWMLIGSLIVSALYIFGVLG